MDIGTLTASLGLDTKGLDKAEKEFKKLGKKLEKSAVRIGKNLSLKLTAPLLLLGGLAAKTAIDFESAFTGVRKTVDATEKQFAALEKGLKSLALEIPISTEEIFGIGEAAGQLGIKQQDILKFTKVMADLGATTNLSANEAATSLARFANIIGLSSDEFDRLGSTIVDLGNNLATTEAEIVDMSLRLAGAGKTIGLLPPQVLALAGALSSVGVRAEAGGTAFSKVMKEIAKEIGTGSDTMRRFAEVSGMSVSQFEKAWKENAAQALLSFTEGLGKIQKSGKNVNLVLDELGFANIRTSDSLLRAAGSGDLFRKALELGSKAWKDNTALTKEANLRYKTSAAQLKIAKNQVAQLAESFGVIFVPAILKVTKLLGPVVTWLKELSSTAKTAIVVVLGLVAAIGPLLIVFGSLLSLVKSLLVINKFVPLLPLLTKSVFGLAGALGLLLGYTVGTWAADWLYGLDKMKDKMKEVAKEQSILDKRLSGKLTTLGFSGIEEFNKAVKSGLVVYNKSLGVWQKLADVIKAASEENIKAEEEAVKLSKSQQEAIEKTVNAVKDYAKNIDTLGDKYLKISKSRFSEELKIEGATISSLNTSMRRYKAVIEETFASRHSLHQTLLEELEFQKAKESELLAAEMTSLQSQLDMNEQLLTAHRKYFDTLITLRDKSIKDQKKKIQELADFEARILEQGKTFTGLIAELELKISGDERTEIEKFYDKQFQLEEKLATIQELSGKKKLDALEAFAQEAAAQAQEIVDKDVLGSNITVSLQEASEAALALVQEAERAFNDEAETIKNAKQQEIEAAQKFQDELKTSIDASLADIYFFEDEILAIAQAIEQLQVTVSLNDQATVGIELIQDELDKLQDKTITITTLHKTAYEDTGSPVYHSGTSFVPQTGPAILERGEMVVPASQNPNNPDNTINKQQYTVNYQGSQGQNRTEDELNMRRLFDRMQNNNARISQ